MYSVNSPEPFQIDVPKIVREELLDADPAAPKELHEASIVARIMLLGGSPVVARVEIAQVRQEISTLKDQFQALGLEE